jgi:hypothetical protein
MNVPPPAKVIGLRLVDAALPMARRARRGADQMGPWVSSHTPYLHLDKGQIFMDANARPSNILTDRF